MHTDFLFDLTTQNINTAILKDKLTQADCGALVTFEGLVRNHNNSRGVNRLTYSAYESMAVKQGISIVEKALSQYAIERAVCVHRIGQLEIGDIAIFIGVAAAHRDAAFDACRFILDTVKADVPIWKQEFYAGNTESAWLSNNG